MDVYHYLAHNNPYAAKAICNKFGYRTTNINSKSDLGDALKQVVSAEGEPALREVVSNHPDKELIIEMYAPQHEVYKAADGSTETGKPCNGCAKATEKEHYLTAAGFKTSSETNTFLMAAALILAVAIISKN